MSGLRRGGPIRKHIGTKRRGGPMQPADSGDGAQGLARGSGAGWVGVEFSPKPVARQSG